MHGDSILLTGATGIFGSFVLEGALERGLRPICMMRDADPKSATDRIATVLEFLGRSEDLEKIRIVQGDASLPAMGLDAAARTELQQEVSMFIHCAACTSFSPDMDEEILRTNVGGVKNVLSFVEEAEIPLFHVSTAYVAGMRHGVIREDDLQHDSGFKNTYEQSKNQSEQLVRAAFKSGRVRGAVFRPAILVGSADDGRIAQFINFYSFMQIIEIAAMRKKRGHRVYQLRANPACTKNLAPADWSAAAMWRIIDKAGANNQTYHLTNPNPPTHVDMVDWGNSILQAADIHLEFTEDYCDKATSFQQALRGKYEHFEGYLDYEPQFDRSNTDAVLGDELPFPELSDDVMNRLLAYARDNRWRSIFGKRSKGDATYFENIVPVPAPTTPAPRAATA